MEDAYKCGEVCAAEGLECGVQWALGPCLDLCRNPKSFINIRSWGDDPDRVSAMTRQFVSGMQDNGLIATGKHFPGMGTSEGDPHLHAISNNLSMEEWKNTYGKVWKQHIDSGIRAIMPGHHCFPAAEPDGRMIPSTISYNVLTKLLREELGFDGLIVTDGFNMGGLVPYIKYDKAFVKAIQAGCDILLFTNFSADLTETVDILENAVNTGEITVERVKESVYRLWREKNRLGLFDKVNKLYCECPEKNRTEYKALADKIGKNSISVFKNEAGILPLNEKTVKRVISVDLTNQEAPVENKVDDVMKANEIEVIKYGNYTENGIVSVADLPKADALILNFYYAPVWAGMNNLPSGKMLQKIYEYFFAPNIPVVMICHGSPFIPIVFPYVKTVVNTFSLNDINAQAIYDVLFGKQEAKGFTPVKIEICQPEID